jgi:DNA helicase-2/ATP-dependent DNA helicase PcrA
VFNLYQNELRKYSYIDFDDMVYLVVENFNLIHNESNYLQNIKYILVDECQDTNPIQYELINKLTYKDSYVFMVGDEDQLIYSFRNSNIAILRDFKDNADEIIILNQNYRCSKNILEIANNLISHNHNRINKELFSNIESTYPIKIHEFATNLEETKGVTTLIEKLHNKGIGYEDIAVLYRNNSQSYIIEKELYQKNIPYTVFGNKPIYKYKEIKQILSVYRFIDNQNDLISFINIFNLDQSILDDFQKGYKKSILDLLDYATIYKYETIKQISKNIKSLISIRYNLSNEQLFDKIVELINIKEDVNNSKDKKEKWERIYFFKSLLLESNDYKETLNQLYLDSNDNKSKGVNLLTIHKAKGLEFKAVFIIGCNEGILPMKNSDVEEERRLMYVAITRAKKFLMISNVTSINAAYKNEKMLNSLFLIEIKVKIF